MPTGYTADVVDGKVTEFRDFALQCARAFGALIMMRDEPFSAKIPDEIAQDTSYYDGRIADVEDTLAELQDMTDAEATAAAQAAYDKAVAYREEYLRKQIIEENRINAMLAKVHAWKPPTPDHAEMKSFMTQQLTISLPGDYMPSVPPLLDGPTWRGEEIKRAAKDLAYYRTELAKEIERANGRNGWLKALRGSL